MGRSAEEVPVYELLEESLGIKSVLAERFGITLEARLESPHALLRGDRHLLRAAINNLIDDAIRNNRRGSTVLICQRSGGGDVIIHFSLLEKGQGGKQSGVYGGTRFAAQPERGGAYAGPRFGMSLARRIADLHGGRIDIVRDNGTCNSTIYLPSSC